MIGKFVMLILPEKFCNVPSYLDVVKSAASPEEEEIAKNIRKQFKFEEQSDPYMTDIIRAFRLIKNRERYLEIGMADRGNIAYASFLLHNKSMVIGIDADYLPEKDERLHSVMGPGQQYYFIQGDSNDQDTVNKVEHILAGHLLDAVFIDNCHTAESVFADFSYYIKLVRSSGFVFIHDALWGGNKYHKGSVEALEIIDKLYPLYLVNNNLPPYRFFPSLTRDEIWGVVAVHHVE